MMRSSQRKIKPVKRDDYVEVKTDSEFEGDEPQSPDKPYIYPLPPVRLGHPKKYQLPEEIPCPGLKRTRKKQKVATYFSREESEAIFQFILSQIRSQHPDRLGRVAKRRIEISTMDFWERCKKHVGVDRDAIAFKTHFTHFARKLHEYSGLSLLDKADLYYALDIRVDKSMRQKLVQRYEVQFSRLGIITGSLLLDHWDLTHPESEPEEDDVGAAPASGWVKFTEYDDGLMWQFIVDDINHKNFRDVYTRNAWEEFKEKNQDDMRSFRAAETYRGRFNRILLPNLWRMPFDIETIAALYYRLNSAVPIEFRYTLSSQTSVKLDKEGFVLEYPDCPEYLVLQSHQFESVIGITSTNKLSTLKHPSTMADTLPYTKDEDKLIWQYILWRSRANGRVQRIREKMSGWMFWLQFIEDCGTNRTWQSLREHFMEDLRENIMELNFDLKTKIELYFIISRPVEDDTLAEFETIAGVILNKGGIIRFAAGDDFLIGRKDCEMNEAGAYIEQDEEFAQRPPRLNNHNILSFMEQIAREEEERKVAVKVRMDEMANCQKYPYLPKSVRPRNTVMKRKKLMEAATAVKKPKTTSFLRVLHPKEEEKPNPAFDPNFFFPDGDINDIPDPNAPEPESPPPKQNIKPAQLFAAELSMPRRMYPHQTLYNSVEPTPYFKNGYRVVMPVLKRPVQMKPEHNFKWNTLLNSQNSPSTSAAMQEEIEFKPEAMFMDTEESKPQDLLQRNLLMISKPTVPMKLIGTPLRLGGSAGPGTSNMTTPVVSRMKSAAMPDVESKPENLLMDLEESKPTDISLNDHSMVSRTVPKPTGATVKLDGPSKMLTSAISEKETKPETLLTEGSKPNGPRNLPMIPKPSSLIGKPKLPQHMKIVRAPLKQDGSTTPRLPPRNLSTVAREIAQLNASKPSGPGPSEMTKAVSRVKEDRQDDLLMELDESKPMDISLEDLSMITRNVPQISKSIIPKSVPMTRVSMKPVGKPGFGSSMASKPTNSSLKTAAKESKPEDLLMDETKPQELLASKPVSQTGKSIISKPITTTKTIVKPVQKSAPTMINEDEIKPEPIDFGFEQEVKQEALDDSYELVSNSSKQMFNSVQSAFPRVPPRNVPVKETKPELDDEGPPVLYPERKSGQLAYENSQKALKGKLGVKKVVQPVKPPIATVPYVPPSMRYMVREQEASKLKKEGEISRKGTRLTLPTKPPPPWNAQTPVGNTLKRGARPLLEDGFQNNKEPSMILKQHIIEDSVINNRPEPSVRDFLGILGDSTVNERGSSTSTGRPTTSRTPIGVKADVRRLPPMPVCQMTQEEKEKEMERVLARYDAYNAQVKKRVEARKRAEGAEEKRRNDELKQIFEARKYTAPRRTQPPLTAKDGTSARLARDMAQKREAELRKIRADEDREEEKDWNTDLSLNSPNYDVKPDGILRGEIQEMVRARTAAKYNVANGYVDEAVEELNFAFSEIEGDLKDLTRQLAMTSDGMTDEQRETCTGKIMELSKSLRAGAIRALNPSPPPYQKPKRNA